MSGSTGSGGGGGGGGANPWYCHECNSEMQPLMVPDPRCFNCQSTFVEQLDSASPSGTSTSDHPRNWHSTSAGGRLGGSLPNSDYDENDNGPPGFVFAGGGELGNPVTAMIRQMMGVGAVRDEDYDGENPYAEGGSVNSPPQTQASGARGGDDASRRPGTPRPGNATPPPNRRQASFMEALFPSLRNPNSQQNEDGTGEPRATFRDWEETGTFTRTFNNGGGTFSMTVGQGFPNFPVPGGSGGDSNRSGTPGGVGDNGAQDVPVRNLASFLHQAFGAPPPLHPQPARRPSDPSSNRPPPARAPMSETPNRTNTSLDYLLSMFNALGGGITGGVAVAPGQAGDYVFTERGMADVIESLMRQAEGRYGPQPASDDVIRGLQKVVVTEKMLAEPTITDCAICKDEFVVGDKCTVLPCKHIFHEEECLEPWLKRNGTCPVCRFSLVENADANSSNATPNSSSRNNPTSTLRESVYTSTATASSPADSRPNATSRAYEASAEASSSDLGGQRSWVGVGEEGSRVPGGFPMESRDEDSVLDYRIGEGQSGDGDGSMQDRDKAREERAKAAERRGS